MVQFPASFTGLGFGRRGSKFQHLYLNLPLGKKGEFTANPLHSGGSKRRERDIFTHFQVSESDFSKTL